MKKLFEEIVKRYRDWRIRRMQRDLESGIELILTDMIRAAERMQIFHNSQMFYGRMKYQESLMALVSDLDCLKECAPVCSREFQKKVSAKIELVRVLITY